MDDSLKNGNPKNGNPKNGSPVIGSTANSPVNSPMNESHGIVVFDGVCSFCSAAVRFILNYDRAGRLAFAPIQSPMGQELLERHGLDPQDVQTFLFVRGSEAFTRSDAALEIAKDLRYWRVLRIFRFIPRPLRDRLYDVLARNRYRWFGKKDVCFVPTPEERRRFLDVADAP